MDFSIILSLCILMSVLLLVILIFNISNIKNKKMASHMLYSQYIALLMTFIMFFFLCYKIKTCYNLDLQPCIDLIINSESTPTINQ